MKITAILTGLLFTAHNAAAADIAVALTEETVAVDTNFSGARLTLFGAVTGVENPQEAIDIIAVLRGPDTTFRIRRFEKRGVIWAPGEAHLIEGAPGLYLTQATGVINDIAPLSDQAKYRLGADYIDFSTPLSDVETDLHAPRDLYKKAFLTEVEDLGFYRNIVGGIDFKKGGLFTINVELPADTPVGAYDVSVFLYRDGVLYGRDEAQLAVNKVGLERRVYELAHGRPVSYGIICVVISLFAGWLAALAFRK